jgi:hypothetical protein
VGIDAGPIETQGRAIVPIRIENTDEKVELIVPKRTIRWGESLTVTANVAGLAGGGVFANGRLIKQFEGEKAEVVLQAQELGIGTVTLLAIGHSGEVPPKTRSSTPQLISVSSNPPLAPLREPNPQQLVQGLSLRIGNGAPQPVQETSRFDWLRTAGVKPGDTFTVEGYFDVRPPVANTVAATDIAAQYIRQFQVRYTGDIKLTVDRELLLDGKDGDYEQIFLPVALAPGLHRLQIEGRADKNTLMQVRYGSEGTHSIDGRRFQHAAAK